MALEAPAVYERLEDYLDAYEAAWRSAGHADPARFLPPSDHPLYLEVLGELVRLDLDYGWSRGRPRPLEDYLRRFPELRSHPAHLEAVAFEEYRQRCLAGENPSADEYARRLKLDVSGWPSDPREPAPLPAAAGAQPLTSPPVDQTVVAAAEAYQNFLQQSDENVDAWCASVGSGPAQVFRDVHRADPRQAQQLAHAVARLPDAGTDFVGFGLVRELGRGAFGRVFLAEERALSNRRVALKVAADAAGEAQFLARLQHTNIVPVYSVHQSSGLYASCMPYLGETTVADVLRIIAGRKEFPTSGRELVSTLQDRLSTRPGLDRSDRHPAPELEPGRPRAIPAAEVAPIVGSTAILDKLNSLSYIDSVLWLAARLADGLAHAHEHGILHRDLKPANILLTDEGQPMLLDFNLAADTKLRGSASAALIGGTLPYMAPEHLLAFQSRSNSLDGRSDVYSLGVILFELLTGHAPFETPGGPIKDVVVTMLADRLRPPPSVRKLNPTVSPAAEAIIRRCLEPDLAKRYPSARALQEDVQRHLDNLPLKHIPEPSLKERTRKWVRRHPRLTSATSLSAVAAAVVIGLAVLLWFALANVAKLEQRNVAAEFSRAAAEAQYLLTNVKEPELIERGRVRAAEALTNYGVLEDAGWQNGPKLSRLSDGERRHLVEQTGELLHLLAAGSLRADRETLKQALVYNDRAIECFDADRLPRALWKQRAELLGYLKRETEAQTARAAAETTPLRSARDYYLEAKDLWDDGRCREALPLLKQATDADPQHYWAWFVRGRCEEEIGSQPAAAACFDACLAIQPNYLGYYSRAFPRLRQRDFAAALADFDRAIETYAPGHRLDEHELYFHRAMALEGLNRNAEAVKDLDRVIKMGRRESHAYLWRARLKSKLGDAAGAERDRAEGLRLEPETHIDWNTRGIAKRKDDPRGALADFEMALKKNPRSQPALENKASVLSERLGENEKAIDALNELLHHYPEYVPARVSRGVLLARLGKRAEAIKDAQGALAQRPAPMTLYQIANIYALCSKQDPDDAWKAFQYLAAALRLGFGLEHVDTDPDMDNIRSRPEFKRIVESARALAAGK